MGAPTLPCLNERGASIACGAINAQRRWQRTPIKEIAEVRGEGGLYAPDALVRWVVAMDEEPVQRQFRDLRDVDDGCSGGSLEGILLEGVPEAQSPSITFARWTYFGRPSALTPVWIG